MKESEKVEMKAPEEQFKGILQTDRGHRTVNLILIPLSLNQSLSCLTETLILFNIILFQ